MKQNKEQKMSADSQTAIAPNRLLGELPEVEAERYTYRGVLFQRLNKDYCWYVVHQGQIVNWSKYRHDLEGWVDRHFALTFRACFAVPEFNNVKFEIKI